MSIGHATCLLMAKKSLTESDICDQFITPAITGAGWDQGEQIRREYTFTDGRIHVHGTATRRDKRARADYLLFYQKDLPLAVVEAKDNNHSVSAGLQQALGYAEILDLPFAFSSNGDAFQFHDRTGASDPVEQTLALDQFPSPDELWRRYCDWKNLSPAAQDLAAFPYHDDGSGREPRYYQRIAIQRSIEAIARDQRRVLLVMATGTGKTYTAFQIIWRLWKARKVKRTLFITDRNILVDQTMTQDFKPFGQVMTKVQKRTIDKSFEVYLALYQAVSGSEDENNIYKNFSPSFFDLIVIDECHRGSAREDSAWREILDYFDSAIHLGLTATPKETTEVSTLTYFGDPVYTYSLKQGIDDGFLAPFKVVRIDLDKDLSGWHPPPGMKDDLGQEIDQRTYTQRDMERVLVLNQRTRRVAEKVVEYLAATDPYAKTIVFCENVDHADRMRTALVNEVARRMPAEAHNAAKFVMRITGDDDEGKRSIYNFIHPERTYPVIATTSKLLGTGVDTKTCKLIVIDQNIDSMIDFKQIIGRGTRVREDAGKLWFTIMDFRRATIKFADPEFDGPPIVVYEPADSTSSPVPEIGMGADPVAIVADKPVSESPVKYRVSAVGVSVAREVTQVLDRDGNLVTESVKDYTRKLVTSQYASLDDFLHRWTEAERKQAIVDELREHGVLLEHMQSAVSKDYDAFDLICHLAYDQVPLTRRQRAARVKERKVFERYGNTARAVLNVILDKYADDGVLPAADTRILRTPAFEDLGTLVEIVGHFGGKQGYEAAVRELERQLYRTAA
jgi:type I restriction enzyme, R subunit